MSGKLTIPLTGLLRPGQLTSEIPNEYKTPVSILKEPKVEHNYCNRIVRYTHVHFYTVAIIESIIYIKMLEWNTLATQLKPVLQYSEFTSTAVGLVLIVYQSSRALRF